MNIGIIGTGKLGICLGLALEEAGFSVFCSDKDVTLIDNINRKKIESNEPFVSEMLAKSQNILGYKNNFETINVCDVIFITTATPSLPSGEYDVSSVDEIISSISEIDNHSKKIIVVVCTVNPGDCDNFRAKLCDHTSLIYAPEFIAQGSIIRDIKNTDNAIIGGNDSYAMQVVAHIYKSIHPKVQEPIFMSYKAAEIAKIAINCYLTTKISFANMIGQVLYLSGEENEIDKVLLATGSDKRIGKKYLNFGFGFGGPCFPRDNLAFGKYMTKLGMLNNFGETTDAFNKNHLQFLYSFYISKNDCNLPFLFSFISYKEGVDIFVDSQQLDLCKEFLRNGYKVYILKNRMAEMEIKKLLHDNKLPEPIFVDSEESISENFYKVN